MTDTANDLTAMLDMLSEHGWKCEHPRKRHHPVIDGKPVPALYLTGNLWHFAAAEIFLADDGRVFLCGDLHRAHPTDIDLPEFLRWLAMPDPVWNVATPAKKVLPGQRNLFGEDE